MSDEILEVSERGLYCPVGDFYVDPWAPVNRAIVTHAHADHASRGCGLYLTAEPGKNVLEARMDPGARIETLRYGEEMECNGVRISLHPAGHLLGSAQVRLEYRGRVFVASGDYKVVADRTCAAFEPVRCDVFLTESTFGLPIYRWPTDEHLAATINEWWRSNAELGRASVIYAYALGKAQRVLSLVDPSIGPLYLHGAVARMTDAYRATGVTLPETQNATGAEGKTSWKRALIVAPPSAQGTPWERKFRPFSNAMASGWMTIRGTRRRRAMDRGFALSDHADWGGLLSAIEATGAERVWVTHGYSAVLSHYLREKGIDALALRTKYEGEEEAAETKPSEAEDGAEIETAALAEPVDDES